MGTLPETNEYPLKQVCNEKKTGCLGYVGDYTTQLYRDYFINLYKDPFLTNQYNGMSTGFGSRCSTGVRLGGYLPGTSWGDRLGMCLKRNHHPKHSIRGLLT